MLMMLRSDSTRGSMSETASAIATISNGKSSAKPNRVAWRCLGPSAAGATFIPDMLASDKRRSPLRKLVERYRQDDNDAEENRLNAGIDSQEVHRIRQHEQQQRAERHQLDPADAALDADAGDDGGGDALERELSIDDGLSRAELRGEGKPGHGRQQRADHVGEDQIGLDRYAGDQRCLHVAADGQN